MPNFVRSPLLSAASLAVFALAVFALAAAAPATADTLAFGASGEVYRLRQAPAGELFGAEAASATAPALALEETKADGRITVMPIPGTDDGRAEDQAGLFFDEGSRTLILHWLSRGEGGAAFRFASYDGELSPVGQVQSSAQLGAGPVLFAADPQLAITGDAFAIQLMGGQVIVAHRTVLNLAWREAGRARYVPVTFVEGQWVGWSEAFDLSGVVRSRYDLAVMTPTTGPVADYLSLRADGARHAAAVTLGDGPSGRLSELEIRFRPMTLEQIGERVRNRIFRLLTLYKPTGDLEEGSAGASFQIVGLGQQGLGSETLSALVEGLQSGLIQLNGLCGAATEPGNVYLGVAGIGKDGVLGLPSTMSGEVLHVALLGEDPEELEAIVGGAGFTIVGLGEIGCGAANGESQGLIQLGQSGEILHVSLTGRRLVLDPANGELFATTNGQREALVSSSAVWLRNEAAAPTLGATPFEVMIGSSTGELLIAWLDGDGHQLRYSRTERGVWRDTATIALSEEMTAELALSLLRKNLR